MNVNLTPCASLAAALALIVLATSQAAGMTISSTDIEDGSAIPALHSYPRCGGKNVSPQLSWDSPPAGTRSLVLTMIDLDVKPALWSHWIVTGLPATAATLPQGIAPLPAGAHTSVNNFGDAAYDGPCPPTGSGVHHYQFTIWAMPTNDVAIGPDAPARDVIADLARKAIAHAAFTATVQR
jgi:Raf kinase inhibitor-like YbhB/YbcL family protein